MPQACRHCGEELDVIVVNITNDDAVLAEVLREIRLLRKDVMSKLDDAVAALGDVQTELEKVGADADRIIAQLQALANGELTPEQAAQVNQIVTMATAVRDRLAGIDASIDAVSPDAPVDQPAV